MKNPTSFKVSIFEAFCGAQAKGNPAGVTLLDNFPDDSTLQRISKKVNLSETAYLVKKEAGTYDLRWFTPSCEVELCGHATLAAMHFIYEKLNYLEYTASFITHSGTLKAHRISERYYELDFPRDVLKKMESLRFFQETLGCEVLDVYRGKEDYLIVLQSEADLWKLKPAFEELKKIKCRGLIVTTKTVKPHFDFISRFFAPNVGINEDVVTGSAHCTLAEYWSPHLGKTILQAYQASKRGGVIQVRTDEKRTYLAGEVRSLECLEVKL